MDIASRRFTWFYALSQLKLKYRYTALGFIWNFLEPALFLAVLSMVFSVVNRMDISDYAVFLFSALVPWRYFEKTVNTCMDSIVGGDWLLRKMYVSPFAMPLMRWVVSSVEFLIAFALLFVFMAALDRPFTIHLIVLPLAMVPWAMLGLGLGVAASVLFTFFRDIKPIVQMVMMLAFFSSPILFHANLFPDSSLQAQLVRWHPITYFAALFQKPIYHAAWPDQVDWYAAFTLGGIALMAGYVLMSRARSRLYYYL